MPKPYSNDLRTRVMAAKAAGASNRAVSERFGIAPSTISKWTGLVSRTGSVAPAQFGGYRKHLLEPHREFIVNQIETTPHLTLHGLKDLLAGCGVNVSHDTVWRFLRREGLSFKKNAVRT